MSIATWNLQQIEKVTRQISGQLSALQFSNQELDYNINSYYQLDLPRELKIEELYTQYTFSTLPGVGVYTLPGDFTDNFSQAYTHVEPKIYLNGYPIFYTQDTNQYYNWTSNLFAEEIYGFGDGVTVNPVIVYTTQIIPIHPGNIASVLVSTTSPTFTQSFQDNGSGVMLDISTGVPAGTVVYSTGVISITFTGTIPLNQPINVTYQFDQLSRPNTCLFYGRQFTFFPTPDSTYQIRIDAYQQPPQLINPTDVPVKPEWGEIIAIGAAMKTLRNFGQFDKYQELRPYYEKERSKLMSDTDNQLMATRSAQRF